MAAEPAPPPGPPEDAGVVFPLVEGRRSTTATGQGVLADAARAVDDAHADAIAAETDWYDSYPGHIRRLVAAEIASTEAAGVPVAGLRSMHRRFEFVRGGDVVPLGEVVDSHDTGTFDTVVVEGTGEPVRELAVPMDGRVLRGDALRRRMDEWVEDGIVEPSFAAAIHRVIDEPSWLDLTDRTVAVLGAAAEMGPLEALSAWGARTVAVDLPRPGLWRDILSTARRGAGTMLVPVREPVGEAPSDADIARHAGADLILELPEAATWLGDVDGPLTLGNYVYADGGTNVRVSMAVDALTRHVTRDRDDVSLAVLATPTDVFAAPQEAVEEARRRFDAQGGGLRRAARGVTGGRLYAPNHPDSVTSPSGRRYGIADSIIPQQGPNYALTKRLHRWRARRARQQGMVSSINVAPPTRTKSVLKNRVLAAGYRGAPRFGVQTPEPETSRMLMAAMLVHDLRNENAAAHPGTRLDHPLDLLVEGAAHGGFWRIPFQPRSVLPLAVARGMLPRRR